MLHSLIDHPLIAPVEEVLRQDRSLLLEGLFPSSKAAVTALAQSFTGKHLLILTSSSQEEDRLLQDFPLFTDRPVLDFPAWDTLLSENIAPSPDSVGTRYQLLQTLLSTKEPCIILSSLQAALQRLLPQKTFLDLLLSLTVQQSYPFSDLVQRLERMGYQKKPLVSEKGEFAVRGGLIDLFPIASTDPVRLEFWGDEIESIRLFDPISQKSVQKISHLSLTPAVEMELLQRSAKTETLLDYLGPNTCVVLEDLVGLEDRYASLVGLRGSSPFFLSIEEFLDRMASLQTLFFSSSRIEELSPIAAGPKFYSHLQAWHELSFELFQRSWKATCWRHPFRPLSHWGVEEDPLSLIEGLPKASSRLFFFAPTEQEEKTLRGQMEERGLSLPTHTKFCSGYLSSGFGLEQEDPWLFFPTTELTHRYKIRRQKQRSTYHFTPSETYQLIPGDHVVHLQHGIGRYVGVEKKPDHTGVIQEFFVIEYEDHAKLFVPFAQAHLLSKYIGSDETNPQLHTLGAPKWKKLKEQTERAVVGYATDLLKHQAARVVKEGFACPPDSLDMALFEGEFPFMETEDQLAAIAAIKADMCSSKPMDRLVCGDVGYGKTEVAMRAAFKAVVDGGKQVAVLVPTTVLAMQHFDTFVERMAQFPVRVGVLSRFRSAKETKATLAAVANGSVDILIGTHRIISQDVQFHDLGLVIIDEEQRFGVRAKEHLKRIQTGVDCLTLSATPIPRTLYMSLIGVRDLSPIHTPPQDRLPIQTSIVELQDETVRTALLRELAREGQAFVIHNRVETIHQVADHIRTLLPQARILVAHGQMDAEEIDSTFHSFKSGLADILVATTIVENGIDIPNANSILIYGAEHYGLATLYQLRGRVGRWNRRAYAYFFVKNLRSLPELTKKRLQAMSEACGYGGGMKVAMRDLELRGAGNLLGTEQSGHIASIGFHLYCKLLKRTIKSLQGTSPPSLPDTKMEIPVDARLSEEYIQETHLRVEIYQRLGEASTLEEVDLLWQEVLDRFGKPPKSALWLYHISRVRIAAAKAGYTLIKQDSFTLSLEKKHPPSLRKCLLPKISSPSAWEQAVLPLLT